MAKHRRRTFLKGLALGAGGAVLGPLVGRLVASAEGLPAPRRLVLFVEGDTLHPRRVMPPEALANLDAVRRAADPGARTAEPRARFYTHDVPLVTEGITLNRALEPLAAYRDRMTIVQGLSNKIAGRGGGHTGDFGSLSCSPGAGRTPGGQTIDWHIAERLASERAFPCLAVGTKDLDVDEIGSSGGGRFYATTARAAGLPAPIYVDPTSTHELLFGAVAADASAFHRRGELMDGLREGANRARDALGGDERHKLEVYLHSLESLRDRQSKILSLEEALRRNQPTATDTYTSPHPLVRLEAQFDLAAAALATGLTDVILIASGTSDRGFSVRYTSLSEEIPVKHGLAHNGSHDGLPGDYWLTEVHHRHSAMLAGLIAKLEAIPEGDGTLADNTLVVSTCDGGETHHASFDDWASVLLPGRNIPLQTAAGGRSVIYPQLGKDNHRQMSNLFNTICHAMGVEEDRFGHEDADIRVAEGPLPELLA